MPNDLGGVAGSEEPPVEPEEPPVEEPEEPPVELGGLEEPEEPPLPPAVGL